jgi:hypothetical protein
LWLLVVPILVLVVLIFTMASVFAGLAWLIGSGWPLLLIGLGAWMFWHQDGRHNRRRQRHAAWVSRTQTTVVTSPAASPKAEKKAAKETAPRPARQAELPIDVQVKVEQIRRKVDVILSYADRFPPFSQDLYLVRQTATDYLPRTVNTFLSMPRDAIDKPLNTGGRTAREELKAQLDLLDSKLDDIAQDLQRRDADRLLANRRFLETRFGTKDGVEAPFGTAQPNTDVA